MSRARRMCGLDRPEEGDQRALDLLVRRGAQVLLRRVRLAETGLAGQEVDTHGLERGQLVEGRGVAGFHSERQDRSTDAVTPALLDRADGAPGVAELREDGAAHLGRL